MPDYVEHLVERLLRASQAGLGCKRELIYVNPSIFRDRHAAQPWVLCFVAVE